jgi:anti-anti-sigma factor
VAGGEEFFSVEYEIRDNGEARDVALSGRLTFDANQVFREIVQLVATGKGRAVALDLSRLDFIDSAGLGMLLVLREAAESASVALVLRGARGQVQRLLTVSHFHTLVPIQA